MRKCIYCREVNENKKGIPHAYPECLSQNNLTLDSGVICDNCNNYFSNLENSLIAHPRISFFIQKLGLQGKKGRIRKKLSYWKREQSNFSFEFNVNRDLDVYTITSGGDRLEHISEIYSWGITLNPPQQFNNTKFSRALHYIACNLLAYNISPDYVLDKRFDPVRKYIRSPKKNEFWTYFTLETKNIKPADIDTKFKQLPVETFTLKIFDQIYFVNLLDNENFSVWFKENIPEAENPIRDYQPRISWSFVRKDDQKGSDQS